MVGKSKNPGYRKGDHWCICDVCGFAYRSSEMKMRWDGIAACPEDWEPRHPQDFVQGKAVDISAKGIVRPEPTDDFIEVTYIELPE